MISNRNIINLILKIKKQVLQPYHCLIDSLFLIERFYNVKKTKKTNGFFDQKNRPTLPIMQCALKSSYDHHVIITHNAVCCNI